MKYDFLIGSKAGISTTFTDGEKLMIDDALDSLPIQVLNKFYNEKWKIVAYKLGSQLPNPDYINSVGAIIPSERNLYLKVDSSSNIFRETIIHEMGHILDIRFRNGVNIDNAGAEFISDMNHRNEINTLMNTECSDFGSHYLSNFVEFFAKAFELWVEGNRNIPNKPNTTAFIRRCVEQNKSQNRDYINQLKEYAITDVSVSAENKLVCRNRYSKVLYNLTLPTSEGGGGTTDFVFSNAHTFVNPPSEFADKKITISYIEAERDGSWGVYKVTTDRKVRTGSGVECVQERQFYFGDPNKKPIFTEVRYYETNVSHAWSEWYPYENSTSSPVSMNMTNNTSYEIVDDVELPYLKLSKNGKNYKIALEEIK